MSQESDNTSRRGAIFTRIFLFRMLAILLFVALGTFAVFQSIYSEKSRRQAELAGSAESTTPPTGPDGAALPPASANSVTVLASHQENLTAAAPNPAVPAALPPRQELARFNNGPAATQPATGIGPEAQAGAFNPSPQAPAGNTPAVNPQSSPFGSPSENNPVAMGATPNAPATAGFANPPGPMVLPNLNKPTEKPVALAPPQTPLTLPKTGFGSPAGSGQIEESPGGFSLQNPATASPEPKSADQTAESPSAAGIPKVQTGPNALPQEGTGIQFPPGLPGQTTVPDPAALKTIPPTSPAATPFGNSAGIRPVPGSQPVPPNSLAGQFPIPGREVSAIRGTADNPAPQTLPDPTKPDSQFSSRQFPGQTAEPASQPPKNPATAIGGPTPGTPAPAASPSGSGFSQQPPVGAFSAGTGPAAVQPPPANPAAANPAAANQTLRNPSFGNSAAGNPPVSQPGPARPASPAAAANSGPARTQATPGETSLEGVQTPSLAIEKIAPREIQLNQIANFKIVVRNVGRVSATEVRVVDRVPVGAQWIRSNPPTDSEVASDGRLVWTLGELPPGQQRTIELELRPDRPGEIGSVAQVTFATQASARTRVTRPELSIEHTAPAQVMMGSSLTLQINVRNNGDGPATNVTVFEQVPDQLRYSDGLRDLEYELGTLAPGQARSLNLTLQAAAVGQFRNIVGVRADGDLNATHETSIQVISPNLVVSSTGPSRRFLKRDASHTFMVQNNGTATATNLDLVAQLPRAVRFVSANNQGQYDPGSHAVYWSLAELRATQAASVEIATQPVETGNVKIDFIARADLNQKTSFEHPLAIEHLVDVYFEVDDLTDHIETGSSTEYRVRIVNQGTKPASNVRLSAEFAPGMRPDTVTGGLRGETRGQSVQFEPLANINPGEEILASITATGVAAGEHRVSVNLQTDGREINLTKEESTRVYADR